jgi:hypothetical protein
VPVLKGLQRRSVEVVRHDAAEYTLYTADRNEKPPG